MIVYAHIIHNFGRADKLDREQLVRLCRSIGRVCGLEITDPIMDSEAMTSETGQFENLSIEKTFSLVYLPSCQGLKLRHMYEAMDFLHEHADKVEETIFYKVADLFNLEVDLIFYDTTTASFHTDYEDDPGRHKNAMIRKLGHAKEGFWAPQVVIALAVTREGIPVRSWVFSGNTTDVNTVEKIRSDLRGWNLGRAMFIADSGMNSENNRTELARACGKYLLACRMTSVAQIKQEVLTKRGRYTVFTDNFHAKEVIVGDGERRKCYVLCYNPKEAKRQGKHREMIVNLLEQELKKHPDTSAAAQWAIELLVSRRYKRYLRVTKGNKIRIDRTSIKKSAYWHF